MEWQRLDSSAIDVVRHDEATGVLEVRFHSGRSYRYAGVPREVFDWLLRVPSKGAFFNRMLREGYAFAETTGEPDPASDLEAVLRDSLRSAKPPERT